MNVIPGLTMVMLARVPNVTATPSTQLSATIVMLVFNSQLAAGVFRKLECSTKDKPTNFAPALFRTAVVSVNCNSLLEHARTSVSLSLLQSVRSLQHHPIQ